MKLAFRTGRLFTKFFLAFFLVQLLTLVGVGFLIWLAGPEPHLPEPELEWHPGDDHDHLPPPPPPDFMPGHPPGDGPPPPSAGAAGPDATGPDSSAAREWRRHLARRRGYWLESRRHGYPFLPVGVGLLLSMLFAYLLAHHFAGPILALRNAFGELGRGNLKLRLGPGTARHPDELESLRNDFDQSATLLESLVEGQRRLLHDVSHEVRSPIARLQLALDLIAQQPGRAEELHGRMAREVGRIDHLVEELLTLSRLEARAFGPLDQPVDLGELLHAIVEDAGFEGQARGVTVQLDSPDHLEVRGHPELLHRAIENVVRNAIGHSPDRSVVQVRASAGAAGKPISIAIEDLGGGVPAGELERMFQPFKRLAGSSNGDGHGLGLAITREAMAAHGGRVHAENRAEGGLRVVLELPAK